MKSASRRRKVKIKGHFSGKLENLASGFSFDKATQHQTHPR